MRPEDTAMAAGEEDEIERQLRSGNWTAETIELFIAEIRARPEDETDKGLLALCELALNGLASQRYVGGGLTWQQEALAKLGYVRDSMPPEHVEIVQRFISNSSASSSDIPQP